MPAFRISKDHIGVLRLQRRAYPLLSLQEQETFELSGAVYGHLVQRNESLDAPQFLARIRGHFRSSDPRQFEIERVIGLCMERKQSAVAEPPALAPTSAASAGQAPG